MQSNSQHIIGVTIKLAITFLVFSVLNSDADKLFCHFKTNNNSLRQYQCTDEPNGLPNASGCYGTYKYTDVLLENKTDVTEVKISRCRVTDMLDCLEYYKHLIRMDISNSEYDSLSQLKMNHTVLTTFNASHNKFIDIPEGFFVNINEVSEIDFSHNNLTTIDTLSFEGAIKLRRIYLANNRISKIPSKVFSNLSNLEYLDLSENLLNNDIDTIFDNNNKLRVLHLENNSRIRMIPVIPFEVSLYISWKYLQTLDATEFGEKFHIILNNHIEGYLRTETEYTGFYCYENSFEKLTEFMAGPNQIDKVNDLLQCLSPSITNLKLSENTIGEVNSTTFTKFVNLEELLLRDTQLKSFDFVILKEQTALETIDISKNNLKTLENVEILSTFENLEDIMVADNQLTNITELVESLSSNMEELDLSGNFIGELNTTIFERFSNLLWLSLRNTSLVFPDFDPFYNNLKLFSLDISYNNMAELNFTKFTNTLNHLNQFYAAECKLKNATQLMKMLGPMISKIDLSNSFVGELKPGAFKSPIISHITLTNTNLIQFEITENMTSLQFINVSHNYLTTVTFPIPLNNLEVIDIKNNNIIELVNFTKLHLPKLNSFTLARNNFPCRHLKEIMAKIERDWPNLIINGNSWEQKHGKCELTKLTSYSFYLMVIGIPIIVVILIGFSLLRKSNINISENNYEVVTKEHSIEYDTNVEPIYEEIGPPSNEYTYDQLRFGLEPKPITSESQYATLLNRKNFN